VIGVVLSICLALAMVPLRSHLSTATSALVLVVPVVVGVVTGGFRAGLVSVAAGFLVYDFVLIPPYYTLTVGDGQDWVALVVYVVVMVLVSRVVATLEQARVAARYREAFARRLFDLSRLLLSDRPVTELAQTIVDEVRDGFGLTGAALLVASNGRLDVAAESGDAIGEAALLRLQPSGRPVALSTAAGSGETVQTLALAASGRPVGLLALAGVPDAVDVRELLGALANHLALALERSQLHERVRDAELLEEIDRLRHALVGAVSHDLRTPLATIKVASSTLLTAGDTLPRTEIVELHTLIDAQTDRLTRIVSDVLDMTRVQSGVLELRSEPWSTLDLISEALSGLGPVMKDRPVKVSVPATLPLVYVDHLLIEQVLSNLLENADRHAPAGTPLTVEATVHDAERVVVSVADRGPGVPKAERAAIFDTFVRFDTGGRAGLGLAIAKAFVSAHGQSLWVEDTPGGGARFAFTLPLVASS
jgi:two-component system sensor histidine kinase KdpD